VQFPIPIDFDQWQIYPVLIPATRSCKILRSSGIRSLESFSISFKSHPSSEPVFQDRLPVRFPPERALRWDLKRLTNWFCTSSHSSHLFLLHPQVRVRQKTSTGVQVLLVLAALRTSGFHSKACSMILQPLCSLLMERRRLNHAQLLRWYSNCPG